MSESTQALFDAVAERVDPQNYVELSWQGSFRDYLDIAERNPAVARNAWPLRTARDGTLHVATASATWAHELDMLQATILEALRERLGDAAPTRLRFAAGPVPEPETPSEAVGTSPRGPLEVPPEIAAEAAAAVSEIDDEELRALVARAARASLLKARSGRSFW